MKSFTHWPAGMLATAIVSAMAAGCEPEESGQVTEKEHTQKELVTSIWKAGGELYRVEEVDSNTDRLIFHNSLTSTGLTRDTLLFDKTLDGCLGARIECREKYGFPWYCYAIDYDSAELTFEFHSTFSLEFYDLDGNLMPMYYSEEYGRYYVGYEDRSGMDFNISHGEPLVFKFKVLESNRDYIECLEMLSPVWSYWKVDFDDDYHSGIIAFYSSDVKPGLHDSHLIQFSTGIGSAKYDFQLVSME